MSECEILQKEDLGVGRRVVFVDRLGQFARPLVRQAGVSGTLVIFKKEIHRASRSAWFKEAVRKGHLRKFHCLLFARFEDYWRADDEALSTVEAVYDALKKQGRVPVAFLAKMYEAEEREAAFKKNLVRRLADFFQTIAALRLLAQEGLMVVFYPSADWEGAHTCLKLAGGDWSWPSGVEVSKSPRARLMRHESALAWWMWTAILVLLPVWILSGIRKLTRTSPQPQPVQVGIRVYTSDWSFRGEGSREIDWLLDGQLLRRDNTLFVIERPVAGEYREEFARRGYQVYDVSNRAAFRSLSWRFLFHEFIFRGLAEWFNLIIGSSRTPAVFLEVAVRGWLEHLRWTAFLEHWRPRHYVAYNHLSFEHLFRNARLRSAGCASWYYVHSVHDANPFFLPNPIKSQAEWAYLAYDNEVHWGVRDANFYRGMHGRTRTYWVWGPLWSAHVRAVPKLRVLLDERRASTAVEAVLAVFDVYLGPGSQYPGPGLGEFYEALAELLDRPDWSRCLLLYKPKHDPTWLRTLAVSPEVMKSLDRLLAHPRCVTVGANIAPGAVIAEADLTVSMAYTSTTIEALGARRRAFFFDPGGKFPQSYYDQFPNLVAHNRGAFVRLCEHWLRIQEADFQKYLDHYWAPEFGGYLDGGAVARFRSALSCMHVQPEEGDVATTHG